MFSIGHGIKQHCSNCLQKSNLPQTGETCIMQNLKSIPKLIILLAVPYQSGTDGPICQGTIRWPNLEILMCIADGSVKQSEAKPYLVTCIHHFNS